MIKILDKVFRGSHRFIIVLAFMSQLVLAVDDNSPTIIQPGAPGESSKNLDPKMASNIADTSYIKADVDFLKGMIVHHEQAIVMAEMARKRTNNKTIVDLAKRIDVSQEDEINFMESWLAERNEKITGKRKSHHMESDMHAHMQMVGMASPQQLKDLSKSKSTDFDRLFLQLMIAHHDGALEMVRELKKFSGSAYDPILNEFIADLVNDQGVEIERMNIIAVGLSDDPRSGLTGGLYFADEAIMNMELITSLKKPTGFFDPSNPEGRGSKDLTKNEDEDKVVTTEKAARSLRSPMLSFSNTDMAFRDDLLVAGSYHGFNMYKMIKMVFQIFYHQ
tara:strand:+ start:1086 stop:2087 length:1002 start_codon:yes stop_codon:yes gene_type:complete